MGAALAPLAALVLAGWLLAQSAAAQDRRAVAEPVPPPACAVLDAGLNSVAVPASGPGDTARIQAAIDRCPAGQAVVLRAGAGSDAFLAGPLRLRSGVALLLNAGATLFASSDPRDYDIRPGSCGVLADKGDGCRPLIAAHKAPGSAVMGGGTIDGRGGAAMAGAGRSWWELARAAEALGKAQNCPRLIEASEADGFVLHAVTLRNAPNFHVVVERTTGFTAWGVTIDTPPDARNTDGIDPISSTDVTIADTVIRNGDDAIAVKAGRGGPAAHVTIARVRLYGGHGLSIGSETEGGVAAVLAREVTIDGGQNGLRVKSGAAYGGPVSGVRFEDVCIRGVKHPLVIDPRYGGGSGGRIPDFRSIALGAVRSLDPGRITLQGFDAAHPLGLVLEGVEIADLRPNDVVAAYAAVTLGPGTAGIPIAGPGVTVTTLPGAGIRPPDCAGRFLPFPGRAQAGPH